MRGPNKKFLILAQPRSGSTYLARLLDSHPDIRCEGELLEFKIDHWMDVPSRPLRTLMKHPPLKTVLRRFPRPYLEVRGRRADHPVYGFKVFLTHLGWPAFTLKAMQRHGWRVIHLVRENVLQQAFSMKVAEATGHWHRFAEHEGTEVRTVALEPDVVIAEVGRRLEFQAREREILAGSDCFQVRYENDLLSDEGRDRTLLRLQQFLGVTQVPLDAGLSRTYDRKYRDIVENHDEIMDAIAMAGFSEDFLPLVPPKTGELP